MYRTKPLPQARANQRLSHPITHINSARLLKWTCLLLLALLVSCDNTRGTTDSIKCEAGKRKRQGEDLLYNAIQWGKEEPFMNAKIESVSFDSYEAAKTEGQANRLHTGTATVIISYAILNQDKLDEVLRNAQSPCMSAELAVDLLSASGTILEQQKQKIWIRSKIGNELDCNIYFSRMTPDKIAKINLIRAYWTYE